MDMMKKKREGIAKNYFLKKANKAMEKKGTKGAFTEQAKKWASSKDMEFKGSETVQAFAKHVIANKDKYDDTTCKRAYYALNMKKIADKDD
jgi:hypothetical protein